MNKIQSQKTSIALLALSAVFLSVITPQYAEALSCMMPSEMISNHYTTDDSYTVALVEAGSIETEGDTHEQQVTVVKLYKGELATNDTVSFDYDENWSYLCAGNPAEAGTEAVYVINDKRVAQVFESGSDLAIDLLTRLEKESAEPESSEPEEPETSVKLGLMQQIIDLLKQMISLLSNTTVPK